jgi:hypothetical protein
MQPPACWLGNLAAQTEGVMQRACRNPAPEYGHFTLPTLFHLHCYCCQLRSPDAIQRLAIHDKQTARDSRNQNHFFKTNGGITVDLPAGLCCIFFRWDSGSCRRQAAGRAHACGGAGRHRPVDGRRSANLYPKNPGCCAVNREGLEKMTLPPHFQRTHPTGSRTGHDRG